jgi:hypothetical protein
MWIWLGGEERNCGRRRMETEWRQGCVGFGAGLLCKRGRERDDGCVGWHWYLAVVLPSCRPAALPPGEMANGQDGGMGAPGLQGLM